MVGSKSLKRITILVKDKEHPNHSEWIATGKKKEMKSMISMSNLTK